MIQIPVSYTHLLSQALDLALMQPQGAVICGSLYLAAEARPLLLARLEKTADGLP